MVPLLLTGAVTVVPVLPVVRRRSPELLIGVVTPPLRRPSAVMSSVPPIRLLMAVPALTVRFPPAQVTLPELFIVRPSVAPPEPMASTPPLLIVITPVPLIVPLDQFTRPSTSRLPGPEIGR